MASRSQLRGCGLFTDLAEEGLDFLEEAVASVPISVKEAWPVCQSRRRRRGLSVNPYKGGQDSTSVLEKEAWPLGLSVKGVWPFSQL